MEDMVTHIKTKGHQRFASSTMLTSLQKHRHPVHVSHSPLTRKKMPEVEGDSNATPLSKTSSVQLSAIDMPAEVRKRSRSLDECAILHF